MKPESLRNMQKNGVSDMVWGELLGHSTAQENGDFLPAPHSGKSILLTGAGGSIGSALAMSIAQSDPRVLVLLDSSEQNLYQLDCELHRASSNAPHVVTVGGVNDAELLDHLCTEHRPELIYHAAAYKHVPLMESNPFAAIHNNVLGTYRLAQVARRHYVNHVLMISTDKAVNPCSIMGASKRISELVLLACSTAVCRMNSIRLGNVIGSQGSVVPLFLDQILRGEVLTVTHPEVERFFFTMDETVSLILEAAFYAGEKQVLTPRYRNPIKIVDLAKHLIQQHGGSSTDGSICFTGLRPGEKISEEFCSSNEHLAVNIGPRLCSVESTVLSKETLHTSMAELDSAIRKQDLEKMLQIIQVLVPEYQPSASLTGSNATRMVRAHG